MDLQTRQMPPEPSLSLFHRGKDRCQATHHRVINDTKGEDLGDMKVYLFWGHLVSKIHFMLLCVFLLQSSAQGLRASATESS